jgi:phage major head subunit gpT-like protein
MIINSTSLNALRAGFKTEFQGALEAAESTRDRVATTVRSTTSENRYGWLKKLPGMREWIGPRVLNLLAESDYSLKNRKFEMTIEVGRDDIEDDNLGQYSLLFSEMGESAGTHPEKLVYDALKAGFDTECFDGQNFFDTDHPITDEDGNETVYSNFGGGSGTPWFLLSTRRKVKPIILQERKPITFTYKDNPNDDNVFFNDTFVYGADCRMVAGYSLPQLAYASKDTLNATNFAAAYAAIESMKGDGGRPLGLKPDLLVVPPTLREQAQEILKAARNDAGATNPWFNTADLLVVPWLA